MGIDRVGTVVDFVDEGDGRQVGSDGVMSHTPYVKVCNKLQKCWHRNGEHHWIVRLPSECYVCIPIVLVSFCRAGSERGL